MIKIHNNITCDYISREVTFHKIRHTISINLFPYR